MAHTLTRRTVLTAAAGIAGVGLVGGLAARQLAGPRPGPAPALPDAPAGDERLIRIASGARGREVDFWTAVPEGYGDGRGLPVCLVLHGASATPRDYGRFGLARFLTDAVRRGAPPFALAGATGGRLSWRAAGDDDPQRMVREEVPTWCARRGFDSSRLAVWGWSMGGFGALLLAETYPRWLRMAAAFSPAVSPGDAVFAGVEKLRGTPVGLWCGRQDNFLKDVRALARALPEEPVRAAWADGRHNFGYWGTVLPDAFALIGAALSPPRT
ncbi:MULTISPECIES: alpha/beta hydrolase-fold protein [unclassified Micromonospora]|uniref:alpha/beta hydrolase n=1 Tax=unclassified Micromonospora TaxID=2617518 RepID=UPI001C25074C|nr:MULTISPECIES: alpha/beta hydrolase-fold protein [unclassified Micromonospora]MBU8856765.1 esterase [Micromonospora sp. WMMB482]MDM4782380.1 alpha/beta hydrolase-fold protein [Micromonospora sp. b486]